MITIDSETIKQPNADGGLIEDYVNYETTLTAINGGKQRTRAGRKKRVAMKWRRCSVAEYQQLLTLLDSGNAVDYENDDFTNKPGGIFSFTGLPTFEASEPYERGGSKLVDCSVVIEEV
jgi:hypothetical protein